MSIDEQYELEPVADTDRDFEGDLYKKWFKAGGKTGFLSLNPWWEAGKLKIDIGEVKESGVEHTNVWCSIMGIGLYLKSVYDGTASRLYPKYEKAGVPTSEGFVYYGGSSSSGEDLSRILKIHHYPTETAFDDRSFIWKTGIFGGRKSSTGAYMPIMNQPKSQNTIKVSRLEMAEIHYRMEVAIAAYTTQNPDWAVKFNGKKR